MKIVIRKIVLDYERLHSLIFFSIHFCQFLFISKKKLDSMLKFYSLKQFEKTMFRVLKMFPFLFIQCIP